MERTLWTRLFMRHALVACLTALPISAQGPSSTSTDPGPRTTAPLDLLEERGEYQVRFSQDAVEFTSRSRDLEAGAALRLRLDSIGRGAERQPAPPVRSRSQQGHTVLYGRDRLVEIYELQERGLKQSFEFEVLPRGTGDLVVALGIETALELQHSGPDEAIFGAEGTASIRIGGVLGIDAVGERAKGSMIWHAGMLEMSLPAAFVDRAVLPLILDPLIGEPATIARFSVFTTNKDPEHDIAYLAATDQYYACWAWDVQSTEFSGSASGQLLSGEGVPMAPENQFTNGGGPFFAYDPHVASVAGSRRFVVLVVGGLFANNFPWMVSIDEFGNQSSSESVVGRDVGSLDVAGDSDPAFDDVIIAYTDIASGRVGLVQVDSVTFAETRRKYITPAGSGDRQVSITPTGGASGRYLVTWIRGALGSTDVWGAVIDRDLNTLVTRFPITSSAAADSVPALDGDGTNWVVAFQRSTGANDILCIGVSYDPLTGGVAIGQERVIQGNPALDERDPSVAWMGESYLIGHTQEFNGTDYDVYVTSVESLDCNTCEGELAVYHPPSADRPLRMASQRSAGGTGDEALLTFAVNTMATSPLGPGYYWNHLKFQKFRAQDGQVADLGGGCGPAGSAAATCGLSGTNSFGLRLEGAPPLTSVVLAMGVNTLGFSCGICTLVPDPLFLVPNTTSITGGASSSFALPVQQVLAGRKIYAQWIVRTPGPCASVGSSLSNALEMTVE